MKKNGILDVNEWFFIKKSSRAYVFKTIAKSLSQKWVCSLYSTTMVREAWPRRTMALYKWNHVAVSVTIFINKYFIKILKCSLVVSWVSELRKRKILKIHIFIVVLFGFVNVASRQLQQRLVDGFVFSVLPLGGGVRNYVWNTIVLAPCVITMI